MKMSCSELVLVGPLMQSYVQERWENHVILRSSIIFGPQAPNPVSRALFLQFIERTLKAGKPTKFFTDEFRSPVYVPDILAVVRKLIEHSQTLDAQHRYPPLPSDELFLELKSYMQAICRKAGLDILHHF